ncbi:MAG: asparagine synthase-related protein [Desulfosoma sp.]
MMTGAWVYGQPEASADIFRKMLGGDERGLENHKCLSFQAGLHMGCVQRFKDLACTTLQTHKATYILFGHVYSISGVDTSASSQNDDLCHISDLYEKEGVNFIHRLDGSFILVIFDHQSQTLFIFKDRLGTRPLYYCAKKRVFLFSTNIRSILETKVCARDVSLQGVDLFLSYGYLPAPETCFLEIRQLLPGRVLIVKDQRVEERRYWRFTYAQPHQRMVNNQETVKLFSDLTRRAVMRRLKKHPHAGAFLSGGLDTSVLTAIMKDCVGSSFPVFTAGFKEKAYDETEDARLVAEHLQLSMHTVQVDFNKDFPALLERIVLHHESPFADTSAVPSFFAAQLARQHVSTVLTGDFPDQLIGGSGHQVFALRRAAQEGAYKRLFRGKVAQSLARKLPLKTEGRRFADRIKRRLYRECFPLEEQRVLLSMPVPPLLKRALYSKDMLEMEKRFDPLEHARTLFAEVREESLLNKILYFDMFSYAPFDLMVKVDRMCTANGLNAVSPFHDRDLVEFVAALPEELKINGNERKVIMRRAFGSLLPERTLIKPKQGFAMPIGEWLMHRLSSYVRDVLLDRRTLQRGYFNPGFVHKMVEAFLAGQTDYASGSEATMISLLTLELWHRQFVDE